MHPIDARGVGARAGGAGAGGTDDDDGAVLCGGVRGSRPSRRAAARRSDGRPAAAATGRVPFGRMCKVRPVHGPSALTLGKSDCLVLLATREPGCSSVPGEGVVRSFVRYVRGYRMFGTLGTRNLLFRKLRNKKSD